MKTLLVVAALSICALAISSLADTNTNRLASYLCADEGAAAEADLWEAQMGCWLYTPLGNTRIGSAAATYAYRGRYQVESQETGFQATCEIWAQKADGTWGWDSISAGVYSCTAVLGRNFAQSGTFSLAPQQWRDVACPTGTGGSGGLDDGFLGLAVFEVWGVSWADWQAATGL